MNTEETRLRELSKELWETTERAKVEGKLPSRTYLVLHRGYLYGELRKPLGEITDEQFLKVYGVGRITLGEIRKVIPAPKKGATNHAVQDRLLQEV